MNVIANNISIQEFENWLYESEFLNDNLKQNSFIFNIVNINYKDKKWKNTLKASLIEKCEEEYIKTLSISDTCLQILNSKNFYEIRELVSKNKVKFDMHEDHQILYKFYDLEISFYQSEYTHIDKNELIKETKFYANQVIENLKFCNSISEHKLFLCSNLKPYLYPQKTLKQKIFAFLKKI